MSHYFMNDYNINKNERRNKIKIRDVEFVFYTDNGVFNKKGLDYGTRLLIENINLENKKSCLDIGCGCGPIGIFIAVKNKECNVDMVDVNSRSLMLTQKAKIINEIDNINVFKSNSYENITGTYDLIVTNPPIHAGKNIVYDIIGNACDYLNTNGELWIVIRKNHGAKSLINDFSDKYTFNIITKDKGFYILKATVINK